MMSGDLGKLVRSAKLGGFGDQTGFRNQWMSRGLLGLTRLTSYEKDDHGVILASLIQYLLITLRVSDRAAEIALT